MRRLRWLFVLLAAPLAVWPQAFSFRPGAVYPAGNGPLAIASGDFNGDGKPDIAVGNTSSGTVSVYLGNGDGSFSAGASVSVPGCLVGFLWVGDFNRDGHADILAVCSVQNMVWVAPGLGNGQFGKPVSTVLPNIALLGVIEGLLANYAVGDFNNDGVPDVVVGLMDSSFDASSYSVNLLLGKGDGTFAVSTIIPAGQSQDLPTTVFAADLNGDGNLDLVIADGPFNPDAARIHVLLGDGRGGFQPPRDIFYPAGSSAGSGAIADVNGDGIPDMVLFLGGKNSLELAVYLGNGDGTFRALPPAGQQEAVVAIVPAHFRGPGKLDLLEMVIGKDINFEILACAGNGDGTFQPGVPVEFPSGLLPWPPATIAGDWNGDGLTDIAYAALPSDVSFSGVKVSSNSLQELTQVLQSLPAGNLVVTLNDNATAPALAVSKSQLQFAYAAGGTAPPPQSVAISNAGTGTLKWSAASDSPWLSVSPASGSGAANLAVSISPAGLAAATYTGHISIAASGAAASPQTVTVSLTVSAPNNTPVITAVVNGASFQPGFESGSWVTIYGSNLSNTTPGRIWKTSEIVNGNLPQSLDGTSVTIDGKPAYVYYISPGQLNVQAPGDSATGSVNVVVTNNSLTSAPFAAELETAMPAFFLYPGTTTPIVSHYPDYALAGTAGAPAHPGDILILWGTGFGPTSPATPAGIEVTGATTLATAPVVTVNGTHVPMLGAALTPESAGLYQIAIQLPLGISGTVTIQASVGGVLSPAGTTIVVNGQ